MFILIIVIGGWLMLSSYPREGSTPLHFAVLFNRNVEVVKYLISKGADVNAKNNFGVTPLDLAKKVGNTAVIEYLESLTKK